MPRTILIVDSSPINRKILHRILSPQYEVLQAGNGREALEQVYQKDICLSAILLDLMMPVMDGYTVLKRLRAEPAFNTLPVIVTTGETGDEAEIQALRCGATSFLSMPYRPQVILARLENLIQLRETAAMMNRVERDSLTGLLNQEGFYEHASQMLRQQPADILTLDICNFKLVNDLYGDRAGDELLKAIARKLRQEFAAPGILLARKTGNQFFIMVPKGTVDPQTLWSHVDRWLVGYPLDLNLPLRVGVYYAENNGTPVSVMCDNAKLAADSVRGRFDIRTAAYDASMRENILKNQELLDDLEQGLQSGQFEAWYQPKCNPMTGKLVGAEALVRWNHPTRGVIPPKEFVPQMERSRLIMRLDRYIWQMVCRDLSDWIRAGRPVVPVSVNVSRVDVYDWHLGKKMEEMVREYHLDPALLPLEITESAYADDPNQLMSIVKDLRRRGFRIEMDDFGSGYSSLNMLAELPVDGVKLDMGFMQRFRRAGRNEELIRHLMELIGCLGLSVTAEGVETREQLSFLRGLRCPVVQGQYYAGALTKAEFKDYIDAHL